MKVTEQIQERMEVVKLQVSKITGISIEQQNQLMFEAAYEWLESIGCQGDDQLNMTSTAHFWGFWKTEWYMHDVRFINHYAQWQYSSHVTLWYNYFHGKDFVDRSGCRYHQVIKQFKQV